MKLEIPHSVHYHTACAISKPIAFKLHSAFGMEPYTLIPTSKIDCKTKSHPQPVTLKLRTVLEFSNDRESMREFVNCAVYFDATERKIHGENITIQYKIELLNVCFTIITSKANQTLTNETKQTNRRWRRRYVLEREITHQYETELGKRVITQKRCRKR